MNLDHHDVLGAVPPRPPGRAPDTALDVPGRRHVPGSWSSHRCRDSWSRRDERRHRDERGCTISRRTSHRRPQVLPGNNTEGLARGRPLPIGCCASSRSSRGAGLHLLPQRGAEPRTRCDTPLVTSVPSPEDAAWGAFDELPDDRVPMVAAQWLVDGHDSDLLREVAAMSSREGHDARRLLRDVLESIGHPLEQGGAVEAVPWLGYWSRIGWAVHEMDRKFSPYAVAQIVLDAIEDVPDLWDPARGAELTELLRAWDNRSQDRDDVKTQLRAVLRSYSRDDVPPRRTPATT